MFHWTISLSDRQVLMLIAFFNAEDDQHGSRFQAVNAMIGDAWDIRAVRNLQENGLISAREEKNPETGQVHHVWNITEKGELISMAIYEDTETLQHLALRGGHAQRSLIDRDANRRYFEKRGKAAKRKCAKCGSAILRHDKFRTIPGGSAIEHYNCEHPTENK